MKFPVTAWALVDDEDTYETTIHFNRREAKEEKGRWSFLKDARWRIVKVVIRRSPKGTA